MKRRGFTDKCFLFFTCVWILILFSAELLTLFSSRLGISDLSLMSTVVDKTSEAMMIYIAFQVWKTKSENMKKMDRKDAIEM